MKVSAWIILASVAVFFAAFAWLHGDMEAQAEAIRNARRSVGNDTRSVADFAGLRKDAAEADEYAAKLNLLLPLRDELLSFPRWVAATGLASKVSARATFKSTPAAAGKTGAIGSVDFVLDAGGAYDKLKEFLNIVESKAPRFLVVFDGIDVSKDGDTYHASIKGRVFFRQ